MDFRTEIMKIIETIRDSKKMEAVSNEAVTKSSLILPFIIALGYDTTNPLEVSPEYTADVAGKKGEKVDYAIMKDGQPAIFIECKHWKEKLDNHNEQLIRYYNTTTSAKFGILTNGITYRFYTDDPHPDKKNHMDEKPFMEFDIDKIDKRTAILEALEKYSKENFLADKDNKTIEHAKELRYSNAIKSAITEEFDAPTDEFVRFLLRDKKIYKEGVVTEGVIKKFTPIIKKSFTSIIEDKVVDKIINVEANLQKEKIKEDEEKAKKLEEEKQKPVLTKEELDGYYIIRSILRTKIDINRVAYKDTLSYFAIHLDGRITWTFCKLYFPDDAQKKKYISISGVNSDKETKIPIESLDDIYKYSDDLIKAALSYNSTK